MPHNMWNCKVQEEHTNRWIGTAVYRTSPRAMSVATLKGRSDSIKQVVEFVRCGVEISLRHDLNILGS